MRKVVGREVVCERCCVREAVCERQCVREVVGEGGSV